MKDLAVAIDLGGTNLRSARIDQDGKLYGENREPTRLDQGKHGVVKQLHRTIHRHLQEAGETPLVGIGLGVPGPVDPSTGRILHAPNLPGWKDLPLAELLQPLPVPLALENDANLFTLGEAWLGAARLARSAVGIAIGTGIGGGVVLEGKLWRGATGCAGEVGHIVVDRRGPPCGCGTRGCAEALGSATGLIRRFHDAGGPSSVSTAKEIFDLSRIGSEPAATLVEEALDVWAVLISSICHIINPECVILGGGLSQAGPWIWKKLQEHLGHYHGMGAAARVRIVPAQLGDNANILGAARLVFTVSNRPI